MRRVKTAFARLIRVVQSFIGRIGHSAGREADEFFPNRFGQFARRETNVSVASANAVFADTGRRVLDEAFYAAMDERRLAAEYFCGGVVAHFHLSFVGVSPGGRRVAIDYGHSTPFRREIQID